LHLVLSEYNGGVDAWIPVIADVPSAIVCVLGAMSQAFIGRRLHVPATINYSLAGGLLLVYVISREIRVLSIWTLLSPMAHAVIPPIIVLWSFCLTLTAFLLLVRNSIPSFRSDRRLFLSRSTAALCATPAVALAAAVITRKDFRVTELAIEFPDLPPDLQGLRLLQLSDIHLGPFFTSLDLARVVDASNQLRPDLALITGDLITTAWDPLDRCLLELRRLRAASGIWGCMGNHERYAQAEAYTQQQARRLGMQFLRSERTSLKFGNACLNLVGVDYQPFREPYLEGIGQLASMESFNLLLSHNPDVFPVAAQEGFDLVLAGHTHGGQINVEILSQDINVTRFFTPYTKGLYSGPLSSLYVNCGLGTIGMPVRLGARAEIGLLRLVRAR
jgi:uncharacterized protein